MTKHQFAKQFIAFLRQSPTPYHAVRQIKQELQEIGFRELFESQPWKLDANQGYLVVRGESSLIAFQTGSKALQETGISMIGAHTDSPCLKVKNQPERSNNGYLTLTVEPYGGIILSSWFDRDLSIAGSVSFLDQSHQLRSTLIDLKRPIGVIPNLAIHLNPKTNESASINKHTDLPVIVLQETKKQPDSFRDLILKELRKRLGKKTVKEVLDYDLHFYDTQAPEIVGFNRDFITGSKLDNLLSCFAGFRAFIDQDAEKPSLFVCNDHEEVGSQSLTGAAGTFLDSVLERICDSREAYRCMLANSTLISVDNSHGIHPNYASKHDENHKPLLNQGPVIKINANQRYATNSRISSFFKMVCKKAEVPVQQFINRSDMACGSTIGPITSTTVGVETLDIGVATFAMHSIRETCGTNDIWYLYKALKTFYEMSRS